MSPRTTQCYITSNRLPASCRLSRPGVTSSFGCIISSCYYTAAHGQPITQLLSRVLQLIADSCSHNCKCRFRYFPCNCCSDVTIQEKAMNILVFTHLQVTGVYLKVSRLSDKETNNNNNNNKHSSRSNTKSYGDKTH